MKTIYIYYILYIYIYIRKYEEYVCGCLHFIIYIINLCIYIPISLVTASTTLDLHSCHIGAEDANVLGLALQHN